ncbi:MAG TPA: hypothetical protein VF824_19150 [Thermoanaerobaculia bacterium]|jgi:hypothetical protein
MQTIAAVLSLLLFAASSPDTRTSELLASFSKTKYAHATKHGVTKSRYKDMHGEAVVRADRASYSGAYRVQGLPYSLRLTVSDAGAITGDGSDDGRPFVLRDARIEGALLTATKVFAGGATAPLEGVFMDLVDREGTSPQALTHSARTYGLGVVLHDPLRRDSVNFEKLFYQRD